MELTELRVETSVDTPQMDRAVTLLNRVVAERCGAPLAGSGSAAQVIRLVVGDLGGGGFRIGDDAGAIVIEGDKTAGLLNGIGAFLRDSTYGPGAFQPSTWRGTQNPECDVRMLYLATHFHNFYQDAPVTEVIEYVEEMALWGYNTVAVWFDRHEFDGLSDPAAEVMLSRLSTIVTSAKELGLRVAMVALANEGYANSPVELRADYSIGHDGYHTSPNGHYHVELCPSKPGALDLITREFNELAERIAPLGLDYFVIWPWDQGGCTCAECAPWGANGYLRTAEALARSFVERSPQTKIILSTWYFDRFVDGEWEGLTAAFRTAPDWVDLLLAGDFGGLPFPEHPRRHGVPGGLPMISFPEISMNGMTPWGGLGANVRPREIEQMWASTEGLTDGGEVYSEGIFEDLNKAVIAQLFWRARPVDEIVAAYLRFEFGVQLDDTWRELLELLEATSIQVHLGLDEALGESKRSVARLFELDGPSGADRVRALADAVDERLPDWARTRWRWRIIHRRAELQTRLLTAPADVAALTPALDELTEIYHAAGADPIVRPPGQMAET